MKLSRSSCPKGALKSLAKFTGKLLCWSLFFNKIAGLHSATLFKKRLRHKFYRASLSRTLLDNYFWSFYHFVTIGTCAFVVIYCRTLLVNYTHVKSLS